MKEEILNALKSRYPAIENLIQDNQFDEALDKINMLLIEAKENNINSVTLWAQKKLAEIKNLKRDELVKSFESQNLPITTGSLTLSDPWKKHLLQKLIIVLITAFVLGMFFSQIYFPPLDIILVCVFALGVSLLISFIWYKYSSLKLNMYGMSRNPLGGTRLYLKNFLIFGLLIISWAALCNTGLNLFWSFLSSNAPVLYSFITTAVSPPIIEEFFKFLPSIIAFFVILKRSRIPEQKGKGLFGNEYVGLIVGIMIGLVFQMLENFTYIVPLVIRSNDTFLILSTTLERTYAPVHIFGGALGGYAIGKAERLRFETNEENSSLGKQIKKCLSIILPLWLLSVLIHFTWNGVSLLLTYLLPSPSTYLAFLGQIALQMFLTGLMSLGVYFILFKFMKTAQRNVSGRLRCPNSNLPILNEQGILDSLLNEVKAEEDISKLWTRSRSLLYITPIFVISYAVYEFTLNIPSLINSIVGFNLTNIIIGIFWLIIDVIIIFVFLNSTFKLTSKKNRFSGKKHVWYSIRFSICYIGMMISFLVMGIGFFMLALFGLHNPVFLPIFTFGFIIGVLMLAWKIIFLKRGGTKYLLHFQKLGISGKEPPLESIQISY
jgi:hypothetical protein